MSKKLSYTLAEILVSIAIVGVIAAVCTPMIINTIPNKNLTMNKKAYYIVDTIVKNLNNDAYYYPDMRSNCAILEGTGANTTMRYLTRAQALAANPAVQNCFDGLDNNAQVNIIGTDETAEGNWKFARLFISKLETQYDLATALGRLDESVPTVTTTDGMVYNFAEMNYAPETRPYYELRIDVNGKEAPNSYSESFERNHQRHNKCLKYTNWNPTLDGGRYENTRFDRLVIWIYYDGHLEIPYRQTEFKNLINTQKDEI